MTDSLFLNFRSEADGARDDDRGKFLEKKSRITMSYSPFAVFFKIIQSSHVNVHFSMFDLELNFEIHKQIFYYCKKSERCIVMKLEGLISFFIQ